MSNIELKVDIVNKDKNIVNSFYGLKHDNRNIVVQSNMNHITGANKPEFDNVQDRLEYLLYRCLNYSSKFVTEDELTGNKYPEDSILLYRLRGSDCYSQYFYSGTVQYTEDSKPLLIYLEIMLWNRYNIIPSEFHNLKNKKIKIRRSNGNIEEAELIESSIRLSKTKDRFVIRIFMDNDLTKHILISEIIELNPGINLQIMIPNVEGYPDWIQNEYNNWKDMICNKKEEDNLLKIE